MMASVDFHRFIVHQMATYRLEVTVETCTYMLMELQVGSSVDFYTNTSCWDVVPLKLGYLGKHQAVF
jgi:hypothetical protein